eukprot:scaffold67612_cov45-Phaeocystis_antarctica.AAC.1
MEEPALSKFKPAQIANVLKEFIKGDNPKAWSISSDATYMDFDNSSSWHSMYKSDRAAACCTGFLGNASALALGRSTQLTLSEAAAPPPQAAP